MDDNTKHILRLYQAGIPEATVAGRMNMTVEQVRAVVNAAVQKLATQNQNGYSLLVGHFTNLTEQYKLVGDSLQMIATALGNEADVSDLAAIVGDEKAQQISSQFIVLRRFTPESAEAVLRKLTQN